MENGTIAKFAQRAYHSIFTDYVSGAYNRAFLDLVLAAKYDAAPDLGVVVFDVQNNATRHVSDALLKSVAKSLKYIFGEVVRYSENRFAAFLPGCNGELFDWAEVGRFAMAINQVVVDNRIIRPNVRVGAAKRKLFESIDGLVCRAEAALKQG